MVRIVIDTLGVEAVSRDLLRWADRAVDVHDAMEDVLDLLRAAERDQFNSEGGSGSGGWEKLADSTLKRKAALGQDERILRATGALFDAVTKKGDDAEIAIPRSDGLDFGTTLAYAQYHPQGRGVPKRPVVQLPEADRRQAIRIVQRYIVGNS